MTPESDRAVISVPQADLDRLNRIVEEHRIPNALGRAITALETELRHADPRRRGERALDDLRSVLELNPVPIRAAGSQRLSDADREDLADGVEGIAELIAKRRDAPGPAQFDGAPLIEPEVD